MLTVKDVSYIAKLANLKLSDDDKTLFVDQLNTVLQHIEQLNELDECLAERSSSANHKSSLQKMILREDVVSPSLSREDILKECAHASKESFIVPKVVEAS
ncbi:hypothetical protein AB834_05685 [PVC group bacterium (ex Bugula neritina AB1)]|nr:hypothetical protein AB834_05685 [PVC group bacterium (ex Bugula neritina AB1)]